MCDSSFPTLKSTVGIPKVSMFESYNSKCTKIVETNLL